MRKSIIKYISQLVLIVFSVVLGLYLSERIEERKNEKEAKQLLSKIKSELNDNKRILDFWVPYHGEVIENLDSLSKSNNFIENFISDKTSIYEAFTEGSIMKESPTNEAWDIAKSHPLIVNIDYDELLILSKVYNQQESAYESIPNLIDLLLSTDFNSRENARPNLQLFKDQLEEIYGRELTLVNYYNHAEKILKFHNN